MSNTHQQRVMDQVRFLRFRLTTIANGLAILNKIMVMNVKHSLAKGNNRSNQISKIQVYNRVKVICNNQLLSVSDLYQIRHNHFGYYTVPIDWKVIYLPSCVWLWGGRMGGMGGMGGMEVLRLVVMTAGGNRLWLCCIAWLNGHRIWVWDWIMPHGFGWAKTESLYW